MVFSSKRAVLVIDLAVVEVMPDGVNQRIKGMY